MIIDLSELDIAKAINSLDSADTFDFLFTIMHDLDVSHLMSIKNESERLLKYNFNES